MRLFPVTLALALALASLPWGAGRRARAAAPPDSAGDGAATPERKPLRIAVLRFRGRGAEIVRATTMDALAEEIAVQIVSVRLLESQKDLTGKVKARIAKLGARLDLTALIRGRVKKSGRNQRVTLAVVSGATGAVLGQVSFQARTLRALHAKVRAGLWAKLGPLVEQGRVAGSSATTQNQPATITVPPLTNETAEPTVPVQPAIAQPTPVQPVPAQPAPAQPLAAVEETPPDLPASPGPSSDHVDEGERPEDEEARAVTARERPPRRPCLAIVLEPAGGALLRRFDYRDEQRGALRGYSLKQGPLGRLEATALYSIAGRDCGFRAALGIRGAYEQMAPVTSQLADQRLQTTDLAYQAELVLRVSLGRLTLLPAAGYFARRFVVAGDALPLTDYRSAGATLDVQLRLSRLTIEIGGGARLMLRIGELQGADWFPQARGVGYAARGRVGVALFDWMDVLLGASLEYYIFRLGTTADGTYPNGVAGGAYDAYLMGLATLRFHPSRRGQGL